MKKTILISLLLIGTVAAFAFAATGAAFSDTVSGPNNQATGGTLFLSVDGQCGNLQPGVFANPARNPIGRQNGAVSCSPTVKVIDPAAINLIPGQTTVTKNVLVRNDGNRTGTLTIPSSGFALTNPPGFIAGDPICPMGGAGTAGWVVTATLPAGLPFNLAPAGTTTVPVTASLAATAGNECQGTAVTYTASFVLNQPSPAVNP
jgi:hypothetical protein